MAKKAFDIGEFAKTISADVSKSGTPGREQIQYINMDLVDDDPNNFYELSRIDELAGNIELCGLQQPIRVRPGENGRYTIVSGHRRRAALRKLVEDGHAEYQEAPCIVEQNGPGSAAMQELRLIYANADTRQLTSAELAKQVQRVEDLLYQLKEEGVEFPGRMRDHVAEACKVSKTKLARLKVIREKLIPLWAALYGKNKVNEDTAYELAKLPEDYQRKLYDAHQDGMSLYGNTVETWGVQLAALDAITCPKGEQCCTNEDNMWQRMTTKQDYVSKNCDGRYGRTAKCCKGCDQLYSCKFACDKFAAQIAKHKAEAKIQKKEEKAEQQAENEAKIARITASWARFAEARKLAKIKMVDLIKAISPTDNKYNLAWRVERWTEYENGKGISETSSTLFGCLSSGELLRAAEVLHCSLDYLYGRADDPQPFSGAWMPARNERPDEGRFLYVCDAFGCVQPAVYWNGDFMDATPKSVANNTLQHIHFWMYQPALPDGMKHMSQGLLEKLLQERGVTNESGNI